MLGSFINVRRNSSTRVEHASILFVTIICLSVIAGCDNSQPAKPVASPSPTPSQPAENYLANATAGTDAKTNETTVIAPSIFTNKAADFGIDSRYRNGEETGESSILESLGGGAAVLDFNNDALPDLFFTGGGLIKDKSLIGLPGKLYCNRSGSSFIDVTAASFTGDHDHYSHGVAANDFDNDGFVDFVVTGYGGLILFKNQGDGTFLRAEEHALLDDTLWSSSAAWGDINGDSLVDLYVAHYVNWSWENHPYCGTTDPTKREVCSPGDFKGLDDSLFLNRGDGTFENAATSLGLKAGGKGLGVVLHDLDQNGTLDVYVANDTEPNFCYLNKDGKLVEQAHRMGVAIDDEGIPNGSMGVDLCDYNRDARPDIWAANYERESFALYRNEGSGFFLHVSRASGITALGGLFVGFGTTFADFNGDAWEDIVISNGHVIKYPIHASRRQKPLLLINQQGKFVRQKFDSASYFAKDHEGRGLALGDFNRDGHPDLAISNLNEPAALLMHQGKTFENSLVLNLIGTQSSRDPIGATATLVTDGQPITRYRKGGSSYLSSSEPSLFFAWPDQVKIKKLSIRWPSGKVEEIDASTLTQWMTVVEEK